MLCYKCMPDPVYNVTLKSSILSKQGNKYGQAYCTSYIWSLRNTMVQKSEDNYTLSLMFKHDVVLPNMVVDKSKEKSLGLFARKYIEGECHLINIKPYSPWSNIGEGCIRKLKRGSSR